MPAVTLHLTFEDGEDGWITAQCVEIPQAISQGRTRAEARANLLDALTELAAHFDATREDGEVETLELVPA